MSGNTYDCKPTLKDQQVMDFCRYGYLMLEGVVPNEINRRTVEYLNEHVEDEPSGILEETWFVDGVIKNPQAAGAVRSLLGKDFELPSMMANHRVECPAPATNWHTDGGSIITDRLEYLQVFYYPEAATKDLGPTEILPGSHVRRGYGGFLSRLRNLRESVLTESPAGTIFLTVYSIWHRRSRSTATGIRNNLKYNYFRNVEPCRDWDTDPDFNFSWPTYETPWMSVPAARMLVWLCGEEWRHQGGVTWPCLTNTVRDHVQRGVPDSMQPRRTG